MNPKKVCTILYSNTAVKIVNLHETCLNSTLLLHEQRIQIPLNVTRR